MIDNNTEENSITGIIPDFFHDVIAYLVPGYTAIILLFFDIIVIQNQFIISLNDFGLAAFFFSTIIAYVIGRFLEHLGYKTIHHRKFPFFGKSNIVTTPKWSLLFDNEDDHYTKVFKKTVTTKIEEWLEKQNGKELVEESKESEQDDYFNLIQFYLRERFPSIALYEKKQNATIVLTRSLTIIFALNILVYVATIFTLGFTISKDSILINSFWIVSNIIFSVVLYGRFKQDQKYHAMYIFESFIATKRLLKSKNSDGE